MQKTIFYDLKLDPLSLTYTKSSMLKRKTIENFGREVSHIYVKPSMLNPITTEDRTFHTSLTYVKLYMLKPISKLFKSSA